MLIRILVLSPFRYIYGSKNFSVSTGESIYLDGAKPEDREEIKNILSPSSEYRKFVYLEDYQITEILKELDEEQKGIPLQSQDRVISESKVSTKEERDLTLAPQDPKENIFLKPEVVEPVGYIPEPANSVENLIKDEPGTLPVEVKEKVAAAEKLEARRQELDKLHYTKVKKIAEGLKLEYTDKDHAIEEILKAEFDLV